MNPRVGLRALVVAAALAISSVMVAQGQSPGASVAPAGSVAPAMSVAPAASAPMSISDAEAALCQSMTALGTALEALGAIDLSSTVDAFNAATDGVDQARSSVKESIRGLVDAQVAALDAAVDDLRSYRDSLPGDTTLEQALQGAAAPIAAVASAREGIGNIPDCEEVAAQQSPASSPAG